MAHLTPDTPTGTTPLLVSVPNTLLPHIVGAIASLWDTCDWEAFGTLTVPETLDLVADVITGLEVNPYMGVNPSDIGIVIDWEDNAITRGTERTQDTSGGNIARFWAEISIFQPICISHITYAVTEDGTYTLGLTSGPTDTFISQWGSASKSTGVPGSIAFDFSSGPKVLLPGTYYLAISRDEGGSHYGEATPGQARNELYYSLAMWTASGRTTSYSPAMYLTARRGALVFPEG